MRVGGHKMLDTIKIGEKIRDYRVGLSISQENLAEKLFVTRQAVSRWEQGQILPSIDNLCELTIIFNVDFKQLLCLVDNDESQQINPNDMFNGRDRNFVVRQIIDGKVNVELSECFYQLSPTERMTVLASIKNKTRKFNGQVDLDKLWVKLTNPEKQYLCIKRYKGELKNERFIYRV